MQANFQIACFRVQYKILFFFNKLLSTIIINNYLLDPRCTSRNYF